MIGLHTFTFKPQKYRPSGKAELTKAELLTWACSLLQWKANGDQMHLCADDITKDLLSSIGILNYYDNFVPIKQFMQDANINENSFWAASKIFVLNKYLTDIPIAIIDTDAILWKSAETIIGDLVVLLIENRGWNCYLKNKERYSDLIPPELKKDLLWKIHPANTGFVIFRDPIFRHNYTSESIKFMKKYTELNMSKDGSEMVFAEQRLLSMMAVNNNKKLTLLTRLVAHMGGVYTEQNSYITHLWSLKGYFKYHADAKRIYYDFMENKLYELLGSQAKTIINNIDNVATDDNKKHILKNKRFTIKNIQGECYIKDPNIPFEIKAYDGIEIPHFYNIDLKYGSMDVYLGKKLYRQFIKPNKSLNLK